MEGSQRSRRAHARSGRRPGVRGVLFPLDGTDRDRPRLVRGLPRAGVAAVAGLVVVLLAAAPAGGQVSVLEPEPAFESFPAQDFQTLPGKRAVVGYLPGGLDRAHHVLRRLDNLAEFFRKWRKDQSVPLAVYIVDRANWEEMRLPGLYGLPLRSGPSSIFVPAAGDEEMVRAWRSALGVETLPMVPGIPLTGTPEQAAALALSDVLLQFEASRGFAAISGMKSGPGWIQEVASHVAGLTVFHQTEPDRLAELSALFDKLRQRMGGPGRYDAVHFSHGLQQGREVEVQAWLWYQGVFFAAAEVVVAKDGRNAVERLLKLLDRHGSIPESQLYRRYPELRSWHREWFREETGDPRLSPPPN